MRSPAGFRVISGNRLTGNYQVKGHHTAQHTVKLHGLVAPTQK